jgi:arylsulfatase A-like enzyme
MSRNERPFVAPRPAGLLGAAVAVLWFGCGSSTDTAPPGATTSTTTGATTATGTTSTTSGTTSTSGTTTGTTTTTTTTTPPAPVEHPSFVFFLGEARGWTSTSTQVDEQVAGSKSSLFQTPNLDTIAAEGMTFADFYAPSPRCMPSRASYFSGKSPAQLHMTFIPEANKDGADTGTVVTPKTVTDLPTSEATVASLLKSVGYATAHFGKWHAGQTDPSQYGFDESDGPTTNKGPAGEEHPNPAQAFATAERGVAFMEKCVAAKTPFYLQISGYGGTDELDATPESFAAETQRLAGTKATAKDIADAAVIRDMDQAVGQVLAKVKDLGIAGSTYVLFSADHGRAGTNANEPLHQGKGSVWEGGIRVPLFVRGPGIQAGMHTHVRASQVDLLPTIATLAHLPGPLPAGLEGGDLWPVLSSAAESVTRSRDDFVVHFPHYDKDPLGPASAILAGDYKLIRFYEDGSLHLFDLVTDLEEAHDLAASDPDRVKVLDAQLTEYLTTIGAQMPTKK